MPTYTYKCQPCDAQFERVLSLADHQTPQACECGEEAKRVVSGPVGMVLRGDGWTGKNIKIKGQMRRRRRGLASKENEIKRDGPGVRLAPNVDGERVDSWAEAKRLAAAQGKDTSSYDQKIRQERGGSGA